MLTDLRKVNEVVQPLGSLQPGMPNPALISRPWSIVIIDLKDCFFAIPLQPQDCENLLLLSQQLIKENLLKGVLPQGMLNGPTLCQNFVHQPLQLVQEQYPEGRYIHYMDDILLAHPDKGTLRDMYVYTDKKLEEFCLEIAPEKVQWESPWKYLGHCIEQATIIPQKISLRRDKLETLNDFQKLLGGY